MKKLFRIRFFGSQSGNRKSKIENGKWAGLIAIVCALTVCGAVVQAQQTTKVTPIGYLSFPSLSANAARIEAFRQGLRELSYVEGKNIVIEWRSADGKPDRLPALAAELVRLKVAVIVTSGGAPTRRAKEATSTIPIVMGFDNDPVGSGFVASFARPGGNITGLSNFAPEMSGKRLELLKEVVPKLSRVAVLGASTQPGNAQMLKEAELAAGTFGLQLQYLDVLSPKDIESVFRAASNGRADAILMLSIPFVLSHRTQLADLAVKNRLPVIYSQPENTEAGASCTMALTLLICSGAPPLMSTRFLKVPSPLTFPSSNRQSSSSSSISRQRSRSA